MVNYMIQINQQVFIDWALAHGIKIVAILIIAYIANLFAGIFIEKSIRKLVPPKHFLSLEAEKKREDTLIRIIFGFSIIMIWIVALLMVFQEFGLAIAPFLATLGIAGVAVGFGGQYLIKDIISGLFIIIENQYRIGDVVCFGETCGLVEDISLRKTILRDLDGKVHHVPHGEVKITSNLSKDFARVNFNIGVSYNADLGKVIEVVNSVGKEVAQDPVWKDHIIKTPEFLRVDDFADSAVIIKILGETKPLKQWDVTAELRKRIKIAFDKEGIEIPFPQVVLHKAKE
ncbi:MAG: mechanosensitive ion channel family protein [Candidatus Staskawiczbacteria bacterium]|nr:mechanosensitive ion channel family protein [Candidatus Staskawiczbacteria bacterium]